MFCICIHVCLNMCVDMFGWVCEVFCEVCRRSFHTAYACQVQTVIPWVTTRIQIQNDAFIRQHLDKILMQNDLLYVKNLWCSFTHQLNVLTQVSLQDVLYRNGSRLILGCIVSNFSHRFKFVIPFELKRSTTKDKYAA